MSAARGSEPRPNGDFGRLARLAYPVMIGQVGHVAMGVVDTLMMAPLGPVPLAGVALGNSLFFFVLVFGLGLMAGTGPLVSKARGAGDEGEMGAVFLEGKRLGRFWGLLLMAVLGVLFFLMPFLGQDPAVCRQARPYLGILTFSILPALGFQLMRGFAEGAGRVWPATGVMLGGNVVNVLLNQWFIHGGWGLPALGISGAALSTLLNRMLMAVALWFLLRSQLPSGSPRREGRRVVSPVYRKLRGMGLAVGAQAVFEVSAFSAAALMMGWVGTVALAAHQVVISIATTTYMCAMGLGVAGSILVGEYLGAGDGPRARRVGWLAVGSGAVLMTLMGGLMAWGRLFWPGLFDLKGEVLVMAGSLMGVAALFQVADGVQAVAMGVLRGATDVRWATVTSLAAYWGVALPLAGLAAFGFGWGARGIWWGLCLGLFTAALVLLFRWYRLSRGFAGTPPDPRERPPCG